MTVPPVRVRRAPRSPWSAEQVFLLVTISAAGAAMVLASWVGASNTARLDHQGAWLSLGVAGVVVAAMSGSWFLMVGFRSVYTGVGDLLDADAKGRMDADASTAPARNMSRSDSLPVAVTGTVRYHRPNCVLASGKDTTAATAAEHRSAGREPCAVCRP